MNDDGSRKAVKRVYLHRFTQIGVKRGGHRYCLPSTRACSHVGSWNFSIWRMVNSRLYLRDSKPEPETFLALLKQSSLRDGENGEIWQNVCETRICLKSILQPCVLRNGCELTRNIACCLADEAVGRWCYLYPGDILQDWTRQLLYFSAQFTKFLAQNVEGRHYSSRQTS